VTSHSAFKGGGVGGELGSSGLAMIVRSASIQHRWDSRLGSMRRRGNDVLVVHTTIGTVG